MLPAHPINSWHASCQGLSWMVPEKVHTYTIYNMKVRPFCRQASVLGVVTDFPVLSLPDHLAGWEMKSGSQRSRTPADTVKSPDTDIACKEDPIQLKVSYTFNPRDWSTHILSRFWNLSFYFQTLPMASDIWSTRPSVDEAQINQRQDSSYIEQVLKFFILLSNSTHDLRHLINSPLSWWSTDKPQTDGAYIKQVLKFFLLLIHSAHGFRHLIN